MNGLFGGTARAAAMALPQLKTAPVTPPNAPTRRGLFSLDPKVSSRDRWMAFAATLADLGQGGTENLQRLNDQGREDAEKATRNAAMAALSQTLSGGGGPAMKGPVGAAPVAPAGGGIPTLRQATPALLQAQRAGIDISDYVNLLDKTGPDIAYEQGFRFDRRDPTSAPTYAPDLGEGQTPTMSNGQVQSVANLPGYVDANAARERAVNDARNASTASYAGVTAENTAAGTGRGAAPYQIETIQGPDGRPITMSREQLLGVGPVYGQSDADRAYGVTAATNLATREDAAQGRASAATRLLPSLDRMEQLLPQVVAGFGSGARMAGNRIAGALGNDEAQARASATETFRNEARQVVAQIIGAFGANPTEGERKYAEQMSGADVDLTPQALQEGIRLARERAYRDINGAPGAAQGQGGGVVSVTSPEQAAALPRGTRFRTPDGRTLVRQ